LLANVHRYYAIAIATRAVVVVGVVVPVMASGTISLRKTSAAAPTAFDLLLLLLFSVMSLFTHIRSYSFISCESPRVLSSSRFDTYRAGLCRSVIANADFKKIGL
jgi:hypothetical protein